MNGLSYIGYVCAIGYQCFVCVCGVMVVNLLV